MRHLSRALILTAVIGFLATTVSAVPITVGSYQLNNWPYGNGATVTLKIFADQDFLTSDGQLIKAGNPANGTGWYRSVTCTVSGTTVTIPALTNFPTTTDSLTLPTATFTARFYTGATAREYFQIGFGVNHTYSSPQTWDTVIIYNNPQGPPPDRTYPTFDQVGAMINSAVGTVADASSTRKGASYLSVDPVVSSNPTAVGDNDRRLGGTFNIKSYGALCDGVTNDTTAWTNAKTAAGALFGSVYIPPSTTGCLLNTPGTVSAPIVSDGGSLLLPDGSTVTITSVISAPVDRVLFRNATAGHGTVSFAGNRALRALVPEWWGAKGDNSTDCSAPVTATIAAAKTATLTTSGSAGVPIVFGVGEYRFVTGVTYTAANNTSLVIKGQGYSTVFVAGGAITILTLNQGNSNTQGLTISGINFFLNNLNAAAIASVPVASGGHLGQMATLENLWVNSPSETGSKSLIAIGADEITLKDIEISCYGPATHPVANTNKGLFFTGQDSYRLRMENLNIFQCMVGMGTDNNFKSGGSYSVHDSTIHGNDVGIDLGGSGGSTGSTNYVWSINDNHFESNNLAVRLKGVSDTTRLQRVNISNNYFTGVDPGMTAISAQNVDGLKIANNLFKQATVTGGVPLTLAATVTHAKLEGNVMGDTVGISSTIVGNAGSGAAGASVFPSAVITTDQVSLDTLEAPQKLRIVTLTFGATVSTDASVTDVGAITATSNTNITVANPTNAVIPGQRLKYQFFNNSGGVMGTITFGAAFKTDGSLSPPASTKYRIITFYWNGANWMQDGPASADM